MAASRVTLANIADGAAEKCFAHALEELRKNIEDENTAADAVRSISLKISFKPDKERREWQIAIECSSKLAAFLPQSSMVFAGIDENRRHGVFQRDPDQSDMFDVDDDGVCTAIVNTQP